MTTPNRSPSSRRRRTRSVPELALTSSLSMGIGGTLLMFAGVTHASHIWAFVWTAIALASILAMPSKYVRGGAAGLRLALAGGVLMAATLTGFLPIPGFLQGLIAPGWSERAPSHLLSTADAWATLHVFSKLACFTGVAFAAAIWSGRSRSRRYGWYAIFGTIVAICCLGALFALRGSRDYFGVSVVGGQPFFAPFVNPNHFGSMMALVFPFAFGRAINKRDGDIPQWLGAITAAAVVGMAVWAGSTGPLLVLVFQAVVLIRYERQVPDHILVAGGVATAVVGGFLLSVIDTGGLFALNGRIATWRSSLWMWADHWLLGTGAGTYGEELLPYRTDRTPEFWGFAHNDWLEWMTTTGVVGCVAVVVALYIAYPRPRQAGQGGRFVMLGISGLFLHAAVDFPFQLMGLGMLAAALMGWRTTNYDRYNASSIVLVKGVAAALLVLQLIGGVSAYRDSKVEEWTGFLVKSPRGTSWHTLALKNLRWWAPNAPELQLEAAVEHFRSSREEEAIATLETLATEHRNSARVLASIARVYHLRGSSKAGVPHAERAVMRSPSDWRYWETRAEVVSAADPMRAPEVWKDAINHNVPRGLNRAWAQLPVGIYWVDAYQNRSGVAQFELARFLFQKGDRNSAFLSFQNGHRANPMLFDVRHAELIMEFESASALTYLDAAVKQAHNKRPFIALYAEQLERESRFEDARSMWEKIARDDGMARYRAIRAANIASGPRVALLEFDRAVAGGEQLTSDSQFLRAKLYAEIGDANACRRVLSGNGLLETPRTRKRAREQLSSCGGIVGEEG